MQFSPDIEVTMPKKIAEQIEYLCSKISKVEWSGILFYSITGDITDPKNFKIKLEDILPMDKGSSAFTSYDLDNRFIDYMMDNPEAMDWKIGHIHSHNTMDVFFSATDVSELEDNSPNHNYYLSLIVNNYMDFQAKVAYIAKTETKSIEVEYTSNDSNGKAYTIGIIPVDVQQQILCMHNCIIKHPVKKIKTTDSFMKKVERIINPPKKPVVVYKGKNNAVQKFNEKWEEDKRFPTPVKVLDENPLKNPNLTEDFSDSEIFAMTLLNFTNPPDAKDTIDSILDTLEDMKVTSFELANSVVANFNVVYQQIFDEEDETHFVEMLQEVIEEFEAYEQAYDILTDVVSYLKQMLNRYEFETDDTKLIEN